MIPGGARGHPYRHILDIADIRLQSTFIFIVTK